MDKKRASNKPALSVKTHPHYTPERSPRLFRFDVPQIVVSTFFVTATTDDEARKLLFSAETGNRTARNLVECISPTNVYGGKINICPHSAPVGTVEEKKLRTIRLTPVPHDITLEVTGYED